MERFWTLAVALAIYTCLARSAAGQYAPSPFAPSVLSPSYAEPPAGVPVTHEPTDVCFECEAPKERGAVFFFGYDAFRGIPDGAWANNGLHAGVNYAADLGPITEATGIAAQIGSSVGVYNWAGTDYRMARQDVAQPQGFLTYGLFRRASETSRWSAALVQDWMFNSNFGVFAQNPTLSQVRGQVGYNLNDRNAIGLWGAFGVHGDSRDVPGFGITRWRSIDQISFFWNYQWEFGTSTSLWVGLPEQTRITGNESLGDYIAGVRVDTPLSHRFSTYASVTYMHPSASAGPAGAAEDEWSFAVGVAFYPGRNARMPTISGARGVPLLPVATNGLFMVDTDKWY